VNLSENGRSGPEFPPSFPARVSRPGFPPRYKVYDTETAFGIIPEDAVVGSDFNLIILGSPSVSGSPGTTATPALPSSAPPDWTYHILGTISGGGALTPARAKIKIQELKIMDWQANSTVTTWLWADGDKKALCLQYKGCNQPPRAWENCPASTQQ